ncbi:MAG: hypothetical protein QNJ36_00845 [Calothrix sp. MO_167.B42]|nr:hypothetical protein [Calothrix sp. MO_167.B42]
MYSNGRIGYDSIVRLKNCHRRGRGQGAGGRGSVGSVGGLTINYQLPTTNYQLPTTNCQLNI